MNFINNIPNCLNQSENSDVSFGFPTPNDIRHSLDNLDTLPWDKLLSGQEVDTDGRQVIRKEIVKRCPEFETKLYRDKWNLIHLASEYGYVDIVRVLISISTTSGGMSPCLYYLDKYEKSPLDYAAMKGNTGVIQLLVDALSLSSGENVKEQLMTALYHALRENQCQAFRALAIKYMETENWDIKKVEIIKTTNKLLMETPRPSVDVPAEVFEELNEKLLLNIRRNLPGMLWDLELEEILSGDPLLFGALSSRSCPLETQFYFCVLIRQTDDLLDEINRIKYKFELPKGEYSMHVASSKGFIHIVKLIMIYNSGSNSICLLKDANGSTPLHCAAQSGKASIINMLLSNCWECAELVSDKMNETALHCALRKNKEVLDGSKIKTAKAFKALLEWYIIKEEFSNNNALDWECGETALDLLVDGYVKILKELLCQKESKVCFQRESPEGNEYFVVIKCKKKESIGTSFKYQDYIGEVTSKTTNRTILSLSVDSRSIITLKVLIRSPMVRGILGIRDVDRKTVFDLLDGDIEEKANTNLMGFVDYQVTVIFFPFI